MGQMTTARKYPAPVPLVRRLAATVRLSFGVLPRPAPAGTARPARAERSALRLGAGATGVVLAAVAGTALASTGTRFVVSQRGRTFLPGVISIREGDTLQIVNDDGDLMHHAYIDDPRFSFDSGDQEPGAKADITFTKLGSFTVLCGIHPKMKLEVTVRE